MKLTRHNFDDAVVYVSVPLSHVSNQRTESFCLWTCNLGITIDRLVGFGMVKKFGQLAHHRERKSKFTEWFT